MSVSRDTSTLTIVNSEKNDPLCDRCRSLGLDIDKFIVNSISPVSRALQQQDPYEPWSLQNFSVKTGSTRLDFASYGNLRDNQASCAFCRLVHSAMERYSGRANRVNADTFCSLRWEIHGRETPAPGVSKKTRRIRLSWKEKNGNAQQVFLLFVAPGDPSQPNSDAAHRDQRKIQFLGREFGEHKRKQALIRSWLSLCIEEHTEDCRVTHGTDREFKTLIKETYFGVIDVADMQLKPLPFDDEDGPAPFVALSYVWGRNNTNEQPYTTNRKNVMTHILHGGLETAWEKLPRTLQDAIRLVSLLNYRYIWIDSLCIVQDSPSSWQLNAQAMHLVYGHAEFTICAADGRDATSGLLAMSDILVPSNVHHLGPESESQPMSEDMGNGVRLMVIRPLETTIGDSQWNQRAWTFQERVMSRRCVIFAEGRVYFQCRATSFSQDVHADSGNYSQSLDRSSSPLRTLRELQQRPFLVYLTYVRMYTGRQLTKPRDVLAAYKGIDWLLCKYIGAPSMFGLPTSHFDLALLWSPQTSVRHRRPRDTAHTDGQNCTQDALGNCSCHVEEPSFEGVALPTWSWSGWMDGTIGYDSDMLKGCLLDVHEWLRRHTWIQWYARDEKGHLRPMSDIMSSDIESKCLDDEIVERRNQRWSGYPVVDRPREQRHQEMTLRDRLRRIDERLNTAVYYDSHRSGGRYVSDGDYRRPGAGYDQRDDYRGSSNNYGGSGDDHRIRVYGDRRNDPHGDSVYDDEREHHHRNHVHFGPEYEVDRVRTYYSPKDSSQRGNSHGKSSQQVETRKGGIVGSTMQAVVSFVGTRLMALRAMVMPSAPLHFPPPPPLPQSRQFPYWPTPPPPMRFPRITQRLSHREESSDSGTGSLTESESDPSTTTSSKRSRKSVDNKPYQKLGYGRSVSYVPFRRIAEYTESKSESDSSRSESEDEYGRLINEGSRRLKHEGSKFQAILPDNPFRVVSHKSSADSGRADREKKKGTATKGFMPILQFFTWSAQLCVTIRDAQSTDGTTKFEDTGLSQCDILDENGDWCGAIVLDRDWISGKQGQMFYFIALSDAQGFTFEECPTWTYYIPKERDQSEWDLYFVMMFQRNNERGLWERVGIGKVFKAAFQDWSWDEIKLG